MCTSTTCVHLFSCASNTPSDLDCLRFTNVLRAESNIGIPILTYRGKGGEGGGGEMEGGEREGGEREGGEKEREGGRRERERRREGEGE